VLSIHVGCVRYAVISEMMQATFVKEQHHSRTQNISQSTHLCTGTFMKHPNLFLLMNSVIILNCNDDDDDDDSDDDID